MPSTHATSPPALLLCAQIAALALTRRLGRAGIAVGLWDRAPTGGPQAPCAMQSRYATWRFSGAGDDERAWGEQWIAAARQMPPRPVLIATSDVTLLALSRQRERLGPHFRFLLPAAATLECLLDKRRLHECAAGSGVPVPRSLALSREEDLDPAAAELGFPCLLKSAYSHLARPAEAEVTGKVRVENREQLHRAYQALAAEGDPLLLQEFLPGDASGVALYNAYFDAASRPVAVFTGRKLRQYPEAYGTACASVACPMPGLAEPLTAFLQQLQFVGPVDIGLKWDARTRVYKLLDVNPRLGQNYRTYVAADRARTDLGWLTYAEAAGLPLPAAPPLAARPRRWRIEDDDVRTCRDQWRRGETSAAAWLGDALSFQCRVHESAFWSWRDPAPLWHRLQPYLTHRRSPGAGAPALSAEQQVRAEFNHWARSGQGSAMARQHQPLARHLFARMPLQPGDRVLDLGCGSGWATQLAAARLSAGGFAVGVDISDAMLRQAPPHPCARFVCAAAARLPFPDGYFTHIFSIESFYYLPHPAAALAELRRVLAPGGELFLLMCIYRGNPNAMRWKKSIRLPLALHTAVQWRELLIANGWQDVCVEELRPAPSAAAPDPHAWACFACARHPQTCAAAPSRGSSPQAPRPSTSSLQPE